MVGVVTLFNRITSPRRGYVPIQEQTTQEDANAALKPLVAKEDDRRVLGGKSIFLLALPSMCDITGTTLMNVGLLFVAASIYQMTRGALVLFVGLFSVLFLKRRLFGYQWLALFIVVLGVALVGLAGVIDKQTAPKDSSGPAIATLHLLIRAVEKGKETVQNPEVLQTILGVSMIAAAQIFTATQFVLEEFILEKYSIPPLNMVGWEGVFGFSITVLGMILLHIFIGSTPSGKYGYFDAVEGWRQFTSYSTIAFSSILIMISIGGFNFFGLSVTRSVSATSRSTIDTCRTLFIWIVSLGLGWETFKWLQVPGFVLLVYGTFLFNDIVAVPWAMCVRRRANAMTEPLLAEQPIEHM